MCFMKPPKIDMPAPQQVVPPPPPLTEELKEVQFGGEDAAKKESSGRKSLTVNRSKTVSSRMATKQTRGMFKRNSAIDSKSS